jgi:hypothetical protein
LLSRHDDYPIHQTPEPIAHPASTDRNVYDRYWFNGYKADGEVYFGVALGVYPNRQVMDCALSVVHDGTQHCFHASRRMPAERTEMTIGPFRLEIVEPMRVVRVTLGPNSSGIEADLTFSARTVAVEEGRQVLRREGQVFMDVTRFTQFGRWSGTLSCPGRGEGRGIAIDPATTYATRDRSWGIRPVGEPATGGAPPRSAPHLFFLWAPLQFGDICTHFGLFDDPHGHPHHSEGRIVPCFPDTAAVPPVTASVAESGIEAMARADYKLTYAAGTRRAAAAEISMTSRAGARHMITLEPLLTFRMKGIGYRHPEWSHGVWKGELATGASSWPCDGLDPLDVHNLHIQQLMRARLRTDGGPERTGIGILEQAAIGPHAPSGFTGLRDGAR